MSRKDNSQLWMVPFADLMTCLVILFLALYGVSFNQKKPEYEEAIARLQKELGVKGAAKKIKEIEAAKKDRLNQDHLPWEYRSLIKDYFQAMRPPNKK